MMVLRRIVHFIALPLVTLHIILLFQWGLFLYTTLEPYHFGVPDRTYVVVRGHLVYSSYIRQAADGAWKLKMTHTTRETPAVFGHLFFIGLGKLAAILHIEPSSMYMASRMAAAVILFWSTYWFVTVLLPKPLHSIAILFILGLEPGPMITSIGWNPNLWIPSIFSYYPQVVAYRHFGLPHHTIGEAIGLLILTLCIRIIASPSKKKYIALGILTIAGVNILPPYFVILCLTVFFPWLIYALITKSFVRTFPPLAFSGILTAAVLLFIKLTFSVGYPWKDFNLDEKRWVTNTDTILSYISTLLLYLPWIAACLLSLKSVWKSVPPGLRRSIALMSAWVVLPALLVPVSAYPWFPLANFRLMDGYNYVPAGVLSAIGFWAMEKAIKKPAVSKFLTGFLFMGTILFSLFLTRHYTEQTITVQHGLWSNVYIANDHYKAFRFLGTLPKMSGLMISNHFGEIAPEFASVRSYIGSTPGFIDWDDRLILMKRFYSGSLSPDEAYRFLKKEDIQYVYFGDNEKYFNTSGTLYPDILTPVFETPVVTVFKVN